MIHTPKGVCPMCCGKFTPSPESPETLNFCAKCLRSMDRSRRLNRTLRQIEEDCEHALDRLVRSSEYLLEHPEIGDALFIDHAQGLDLREAIAFMREKIKTLTHNLEGGVRAKFFDIHIDPALSPNRGYMPARRMMSSILEFNRIAEQNGVRYRVACVSSFSLFQEREDVEVIRQNVFKLIEQTPSLDWQLLTKRPENMLRMLPKSWLDRPLKNVWLGTTAEDQQRAEDRIPHLLATPAVVRFVSCEPLLEPITLQQNWLLGAFDHCPDEVDNDCLGCPGYSLQGGDYCGAVRGPRLSWIIVGGESGPGARVFRAEWARSIVRQCKEAGVPCFVKQMGAAFVDEVNGICGRDVVVPPEASPPRRLADRAGADPAEWPTNLLVREFPRGVV